MRRSSVAVDSCSSSRNIVTREGLRMHPHAHSGLDLRTLGMEMIYVLHYAVGVRPRTRSATASAVAAESVQPRCPCPVL